MCLCVCVSVCLSVCVTEAGPNQNTRGTSVCLSVWLGLDQTRTLEVRVSVCLSVCLSVWLGLDQTRTTEVRVCDCLSVCLAVSVRVRVCVCVYACMQSKYQFISIMICLQHTFLSLFFSHHYLLILSILFCSVNNILVYLLLIKSVLMFLFCILTLKIKISMETKGQWNANFDLKCLQHFRLVSWLVSSSGVIIIP